MAYDIYNKIIDKDDITLVDTVSMLRHYNNVWGISKKDTKKLNTDYETISEIIELPGELYVKSLINNKKYLQSEITKKEEKEKAIYDAHIRNMELISILEDKRTNMCGIGTRKLKIRLNKLSKEDFRATLFRKTLECEDKNIQAKNSSFYYVDKIYREKQELIEELIELSKKYNIIYGIQDSDVSKVNYIVYFELPNCEQISFHSDLSNHDIPVYQKPWDGKINSTLDKLEEAILKTFPTINKS